MAKAHIGNVIVSVDSLLMEYISTDAASASCELTLPDDFDLSTIRSGLMALQNQTIQGVSVYDDQNTNKIWENTQDFKLASINESLDFVAPANQDSYRKIIRLEVC